MNGFAATFCRRFVVTAKYQYAAWFALPIVIIAGWSTPFMRGVAGDCVEFGIPNTRLNLAANVVRVNKTIHF